MELSATYRISGTVLKRMPRSDSFVLGLKSKSWRHKSGEYGDGNAFSSQSEQTHQPFFSCMRMNVSWKIMGGLCRKCRHSLLNAGRRWCSRKEQSYCTFTVRLDDRPANKHGCVFCHWVCVSRLWEDRIRSEVRQVCDVSVMYSAFLSSAAWHLTTVFPLLKFYASYVFLGEI